MPKAIVCGGSIGGLFAANALRHAGWHVDLFERTPVPLSGRGAGIVTHAELIDALRALDIETDDLGVDVTQRVAFAQNGSPIATLDYPQVVTSWDRMHQILRQAVPEPCIHLGRAVIGYRDFGNTVAAVFEDGMTQTADLLVGADGFRSAIRAQMLPDVQPDYAGYVVWRALAHEADIPQAVRDQVFDAFGFYLPHGGQIIGYPIAGPDNDLRPGHRRYNFVWYVPVKRADLNDMLTDTTGHRHKISIPPPLVRDDVLNQMIESASHRLPAPFFEILKVGEKPFFTPIYDHHSPVMATGRVALAGDAACVARPHVGMGVTKAALDALALARHVTAGQSVETGLAAYSGERTVAARQAYERAQWLGEFLYSGSPELNTDGRSHPDIDTVMRETAVVV